MQSNYIPWKGYFDLIAAVDEFILYDDVQFTKRDWRNRNKIKTPQGLHWLTVPVRSKGRYSQAIRETEINGEDWAEGHWKSLVQNYSRAPCFSEVEEWLRPLYLEKHYYLLSELNSAFIKAICDYLGIKTRISRSSEYELWDGQTERLLGLCVQGKADEYISGPAAKDYLDEAKFTEHGVNVAWFDYSGYPEYPQLWGDFVHGVSILDLLFNCGKDSINYMKHVK